VLVYRPIVDQFEASAPDDTTWLDVILAVHRHLDPTGRAEAASVVHGFVLHGAYFTVTPAEARESNNPSATPHSRLAWETNRTPPCNSGATSSAGWSWPRWRWQTLTPKPPTPARPKLVWPG
jgi:hypothetical protein